MRIIISNQEILNVLYSRKVYPIYYDRQGRGIFLYCKRVLNELARSLRKQ